MELESEDLVEKFLEDESQKYQFASPSSVAKNLTRVGRSCSHNEAQNDLP